MRGAPRRGPVAVLFRRAAIEESLRILVVKPSSLGDIVHTFPAVALLRQTAPKAIIDWVVADNLADTAAMCPGGVSRLVVFPRKQLHSFHLGCLGALWRGLRQESYAAIIDFQGLLRSGLMSRIARSPLRIGFAHAREGAPLFYTHKVALPTELRQAHAAEKNLHLMRAALNLLELPIPQAVPDAPPTLPAGWRDRALAKLTACGLAGDGPLIAVAASSRWESKSWPATFFAAVLTRLAGRRPDARIWLLGAPGEDAERAAHVVAALDDEATRRAVRNLAGQTTIAEMTALLASSQAMLTNDSGPMHIAAALHVPCVALFGATDDRLTGPYGPPGRHTVIRSHCPQSPCFRRQCPRDGHPCAEGLDPAEVARLLEQKLE